MSTETDISNVKWALISVLMAALIMVFAQATLYHSIGVWADDIDEAKELCTNNDGLHWIGVDGDILCRNGARFK